MMDRERAKEFTIDWQHEDIQKELDELVARGFTVDPENGEILHFNANYFADFVKKSYDICFMKDDFFTPTVTASGTATRRGKS